MTDRQTDRPNVWWAHDIEVTSSGIIKKAWFLWQLYVCDDMPLVGAEEAKLQMLPETGYCEMQN
jgi:hypothetical protein